MKTRIFWVPIAVLVVVAVGSYFHRRGALPLLNPPAPAARATGTDAIEPPPPALPLVTASVPVVPIKPIPLPPIRIPHPPQRLAPELLLPLRDRAMFELSIGSPALRRGGDGEALERTLGEIEEAAKNLAIPGTTSPPRPR